MNINVKEIKQKINLQEFLLENKLELEEGLTKHKLSDKLKKLLEILEGKRFIKSSEDDVNALDKAELALREMIPAIKKIENSYEKGNISRGQALEAIRRYKTKAQAVRKYLQYKKVLSKIDWRYLITTGLSLVWIPLALTRAKDLMNILLPNQAGSQ